MVLSDPRTREPGRRRRSIVGRTRPIHFGEIRNAAELSSVSFARVVPGALAWAAIKKSLWPIGLLSRSKSLWIIPRKAKVVIRLARPQATVCRGLGLGPA